MYKKLPFAALCLLSLCARTEAEVIDGEDFVDPTRPLFISNAGTDDNSDVLAMIRNVVPSSYDLSFIRAGSSPIAVINQERVTVGDIVGGATVVAIDRSSVTLSRNGEETRISIYADSVKRPVAQ